MSITVDGVTYANVGDWNRAMDAKAVADAPSLLPSAAAGPRDLAISPDLLAPLPTLPEYPPPRGLPGWAGGKTAAEAIPALSGTIPPIVGRGIPGLAQSMPAAATPPTMQGPAGGGTRMAWEQAAPLISATESNDRNVPNYRYDAGHTASGHFQITDTNWRSYGPRVGVDVAQFPTAMSAPKEAQAAVAKLMYQEQGFAPWAPYNTRLARMIGWRGPQVGGALAGARGQAGSLDAALAPSLLSEAGSSSTPARAAPSPAANLQLQAQPQTAAAPSPAGHVMRAANPLQPVPLPPAPNLVKGYQDALASVLNGQRRGFGSVFG